MILLGLVELFLGLFFAIIDFLPTWTAPAAIQSGGTVSTYMASLGGYAAGFSYWVPWPVFGQVVVVILAAFGVAIAIWAVRKLLDLSTLGKVH
jgi:hypothetical protein